MKKFNKKALVLLVCASLLLTFAVSSTVAYLVDADGPVVNEFKPATVDITTTDKIENGAKKDVSISNSSTIPIYVRVAVVANWYNADGEIVAPWNESVYGELPVSKDWLRIGDYYYYKSAVPAETKRIDFFTAGESYKPSTSVTDAHLEMTIIAQAIQAEPETTVEDEWNVEVENGVITGAKNSTNA